MQNLFSFGSKQNYLGQIYEFIFEKPLITLYIETNKN